MADRDSYIGIFDSGVGGLAAVNTLLKTFPKENIIYIADSKNFPYGTKTESQIKAFSTRIVRYLIQENVKAIIVACNTVSSISLPELKKIAGNIPVFGMVQAGASLALKKTKNFRIGVISTPLTAKMHAYKKTFQLLNNRTKVFEVGSQELVNLVEDGNSENKIAFSLAQQKLSGMLNEGIDTLVLGCTHFPFLYKVVRSVVGESIAIVDPSEELSFQLKESLSNTSLIKFSGRPKRIFLTTGDKEEFLAKAKIFLNLKEYDVNKIGI